MLQSDLCFSQTASFSAVGSPGARNPARQKEKNPRKFVLIGIVVCFKVVRIIVLVARLDLGVMLPSAVHLRVLTLEWLEV